MSTPLEFKITRLHHLGADTLGRRWGWFLGLGILLIVLGTVAMSYSAFATLMTVALIGWLLMLAGLLEAIHAFGCQAWGGFFLDLLTGLLYLVAGLFLIIEPAESALALTLIIALALIFGGVFRILVAVIVRLHHWVWLLLHGAINVLLGICIWKSWPVSGLMAIGLFVGIDMIFNGWSLVMLGLMARRLFRDTSSSSGAPSAV